MTFTHNSGLIGHTAALPVQCREADDIIVAAIQLNSTNNKFFNFKRTVTLVMKALEENPAISFISLPECCAFMGASMKETIAAAEIIDVDISLNGDSSEYLNNILRNDNIDKKFSYIESLCHFARLYQLWISVGGFPEKRFDIPDNNANYDIKMSNTHFIISPEGRISSDLYRKVHLFDSPLTGLHESKSTVAGDRLVRANVSGWDIGLSICYDLRFPEFYQALVYGSDTMSRSSGRNENTETDKISIQDNCAQLLLVPSAFTVPTGTAHWEILLRARAIETQCYVIAAAQAGRHNEKRTSYGHTMIIDPWGKIVASLGSELEGYCLAALSKNVINKIRSDMPVKDHRKRDCYTR